MVCGILYVVVSFMLYIFCLKQDKKKCMKTDEILKVFYMVFALFWPFYISLWLVYKLFSVVGGYFVKG